MFKLGSIIPIIFSSLVLSYCQPFLYKAIGDLRSALLIEYSCNGFHFCCDIAQFRSAISTSIQLMISYDLFLNYDMIKTHARIREMKQHAECEVYQSPCYTWIHKFIWYIPCIDLTARCTLPQSCKSLSTLAVTWSGFTTSPRSVIRIF